MRCAASAAILVGNLEVGVKQNQSGAASCRGEGLYITYLSAKGRCCSPFLQDGSQVTVLFDELTSCNSEQGFNVCGQVFRMLPVMCGEEQALFYGPQQSSLSAMIAFGPAKPRELCPAHVLLLLQQTIRSFRTIIVRRQDHPVHQAHKTSRKRPICQVYRRHCWCAQSGLYVQRKL